MKKYLIISFLFALCFSAFSQGTKTINMLYKSELMDYTTYIAPTQIVFSATTDKVGKTADSIYSLIINTNQSGAYDYEIRHKIAKVDSAKATIKLQGRIFETDNWTDLNTVRYGATAADTTIIFRQAYAKGSFYNSDTIRTRAIDSVAFKISPGVVKMQSSKVYYRQFRIYHDADAAKTGSYLLKEIEVKLWR